VKRKINSALQQGLKFLGRRMTPDDLKSRGVRTIRSVSSEQVSHLIERAVNQTLLERTMRVSTEEMDALVKDSHRKVLALLQSQLDLRQRQRRIEEAHEELSVSLKKLDTAAPVPVPGAQKEALLERRLQKLLRYVEETEQALKQALSYFDQGLASVYREVQGISPEDPFRLIKSLMLKQLFEANQALQQG
jgi:hypothetical protein